MKRFCHFVKFSLLLIAVPLVIFFAVVIFYPLTPHVEKKDTWIDEDGSTAIHIGDNSLSIHSMNNFHFFEKVYNAATVGRRIRLCIGPDKGYGIAQNCFEHFRVTPMSSSKGQTHSLIFDSKNDDNSFIPFKQVLKNGNAIKISVDDYLIFASYSLHDSHKLLNKYKTRLTWIE